MAIITQLHTITYELSIDTDTGEIIGTKIVSKKEENNTAPKKSTKKKTIEEDSTPKVYLEENKLKLNTAALELLGVEAGNKLDVQYDKNNNPIIGTPEAFGSPKLGNKLTKSGTIAFRGSKNEELAKWGNEFNLVDRGNGIFGMVNDQIVQDEEEVTDENIEIPDDIDLSLSVDSLIDDAEEVDANMFKL